MTPGEVVEKCLRLNTCPLGLALGPPYTIMPAPEDVYSELPINPPNATTKFSVAVNIVDDWDNGSMLAESNPEAAYRARIKAAELAIEAGIL